MAAVRRAWRPRPGTVPQLLIFVAVLGHLAAGEFALWAGGSFQMFVGEETFYERSTDLSYVVKINSDSSFSSPGGLNNAVNALVGYQGKLILGGYFTTTNGRSALYITAYDGRIWSTLGAGVDQPVRTLAVMDDVLYVGGWFQHANGLSARHIASWNGNEWRTLGQGCDDLVTTMAAFNGELYVGGLFTSAGGVAASRVARWNPYQYSWSDVGAGVDGQPMAMHVIGDLLYIGGEFNTAGGMSANYTAAIDRANQWHKLGVGTSADVYALTSYKGELVVGGRFGSANSGSGWITCRCLCRWNGSSWAAFPGGIFGGTVSALAVFNNTLYASGLFTEVDTSSIKHLAAFNAQSSQWYQVGSGLEKFAITFAIVDLPPEVDSTVVRLTFIIPEVILLFVGPIVFILLLFFSLVYSQSSSRSPNLNRTIPP